MEFTFLYYLFLLVCALSITASAQGTTASCQGLISRCVQEWNIGVNNTKGDQYMTCLVGKNLADCLLAAELTVDCEGNTNLCEAALKQYQGQINARACAGIIGDCTGVVETCKANYQAGLNGTSKDDKTTQCQVRQIFANCLLQAELDKACINKSSVVDNMRMAYANQINSGGCSVDLGGCLGVVQRCKTEFLIGINGTSDKSMQCTVRQQFSNCLLEAELMRACTNKTDMISNMKKTFASQISQAGCGCGAITMSLLCLITGLFIALKDYF